MFQWIKNLFKKENTPSAQSKVTIELLNDSKKIDIQYLKELTGYQNPATIIHRLRKKGWEIITFRDIKGKFLFYKLNKEIK